MNLIGFKMCKKFSLILIFFCVILVGIGSVSATDSSISSYDLNDTDYQDSSSIEVYPYDAFSDINDGTFNEVQSVFEFQDSSSSKNDDMSVSPDACLESLNETSAVVHFTGSKSSELFKQIETLNDGDTLVFDHDVSLDMTYMPIHKSITIDGNFHSIGGLSICKIFKVLGNDVVFKNINFYDVYNPVEWCGQRGTVDGCTFKKNSVSLEWKGSEGTIRNCTFMDNDAWNPLTISGSKCKILGCTFKGNNGRDGAAVAIFGSDCCVDGCTFEKNTASLHGGAIYVKGVNSHVKNCIFKENNAVDSGSIHIYANNCIVERCIFSNNSASHDGAISMNAKNCKVVGCNFTANHSPYYTGAILISGSGCCVDGCTFQKNTAKTKGGAVYICREGANAQVKNCVFKENSAYYGGAVYINGEEYVIDGCIFEKNNADYGGGMFCDCGNGLIENAEFDSNAAVNDGAAIFLSGFSKNTGVVDCDFYKNHGKSVISATHEFVPSYVTAVSHADIKRCNFYLNDANNAIVTFDGVDVTNCAFYKNSGKNIYNIDSSYGSHVKGCWFGNTKSDSQVNDQFGIMSKCDGRVIIDDYYILNDEFTTSNALMYEKTTFIYLPKNVENCDLRLMRFKLTSIPIEDTLEGSLGFLSEVICSS